jgi:hypothetical protein
MLMRAPVGKLRISSSSDWNGSAARHHAPGMQLDSVIKDGTTVDTGAYMEVLRKKGGKWLIVRDIWNSSTPPPTAPPPSPAAAAAPKKLITSWPGMALRH